MKPTLYGGRWREEEKYAIFFKSFGKDCSFQLSETLNLTWTTVGKSIFPLTCSLPVGILCGTLEVQITFFVGNGREMVHLPLMYNEKTMLKFEIFLP